ncbi:troponin C-akin-1 protein-like [Eurosta solidaginis]|uniref:troponin C-akin-1 protein-like n=1 Tax=Eurosta solidaginis TaxID=178769 RepID=UPI0035313260
MLSSLDNLEDCQDVFKREVQDMNIGVGEGTVPCWVYLLQEYPENLLTRPFYASYENSSTHPYVMRHLHTHKHPPQVDLAYYVAQ